MKEQLTHIDAAKGVLILFMLIGHVWDDGPVHQFVYAFHMPAFFLISGILFHSGSSSDKPIWKVILRKARLLLIPYLCFEIYAIVVDVLTRGAYLNIKGYLYQVVTLTLTNGPLWFLIVLFCSECLFLVVQRLWRKAGICVLAAILFAASWFLPKFDTYINITSILLALFFLCAGYILQPWLNKENYWFAAGALILVGVLSQINTVDISNYQDGLPGVFLLTSFAGTYAVLCFSRSLHSRLLYYFGQNSLIILGTHMPIERTVKHLLRIEHFATGSGLLFLLILLAVELGLIFVINRYLPFILGRWYSDPRQKTGSEHNENNIKGTA